MGGNPAFMNQRKYLPSMLVFIETKKIASGSICEDVEFIK